MTITVNGKTTTKEGNQWIKTILSLASKFFVDGKRVDKRKARKEMFKRKSFDTHRYEDRFGKVHVDVMI